MLVFCKVGGQRAIDIASPFVAKAQLTDQPTVVDSLCDGLKHVLLESLTIAA